MKFRFYRIRFQDNKKDLTEETRLNLGTPWFTSSSVPGLGHLTAVFIQLSVMNSSQPGQPGFQLFFLLGRESQGLNILFMNPVKILQCFKYMGVFLEREL